MFGQRVEGIVGEAGGAYHCRLLDKRSEFDFGEHVIYREHPCAVGQLGELLHNLHVLHEVDIALLGDGEFASLHLIRRVGKDVYVATESEVLLVVGQEMEVDALVALHIECVHDIESIERHGILSDGRGEGILQESYLVVIDIDVGEHVLEHCVEDISRLEEVVDSGGVLSLHDILL